MKTKKPSKLPDKFVKENERLIKKVLGKYSWVDDYDDLLQEARIWLVAANEKWDHNRSSWETFAINFLRWHFKNYVRKMKSNKSTASANGYSCVGLDAILERDLSDACVVSMDDEDSRMDAKTIYDAVMASISDERTKDMLAMHLIGYSNVDIGKKHGVSKQRVWQICKKAMAQIRSRMVKP